MKLELINITKKYGEVVALNQFSHCFTSGIYGILGANGAGKSTLFNLLTDNVRRDAGSILLDGNEILDNCKSYRSIIGYLPQQQGFYENMSAISYMKYVAGLKGIKKNDCKIQSQQLLEKVGMWSYRYKLMGTLSGGMRQRVLIACTFLGNPDILILDEPSSGLDPKERVELRNLIKSMSGNKIILLSTHIVSDLADLADCVIIMNKGSVVVSGTYSELLQKFEADNLEEAYLAAINMS